MNRTKHALAAVAGAFAVLVAFVALAAIGDLGSGCELVVQVSAPLDGGGEDVVLGACPICGPAPDASDASDDGAATDASASLGGDSEASAD